MEANSKKTNKSKHTLLLWDEEGLPPKGPWIKVLWRGFSESKSIDTISIPSFVEDNADSLRQKYLEWIYKLGETRVSGRRLVDHLAFRNEFSYWWMTLFVEKSYYKSPISDAIRLIAFEEIIKRYSPYKVKLISARRDLNKCIKVLCKNLEIGYEWISIPMERTHTAFGSLIARLPGPIRAMGILLYRVISRWPMKAVRSNCWFAGDNAAFLCSYFIHLDQKLCSQGRFYSRQWEALPQILHENGYRTNWIQHYLPSSTIPSTEIALKLIRQFNHTPHSQGFHAFLDSFLCWSTISRVLKGYLKLFCISLRLKGVHSAFRPTDSQITFWPLMKKDWYGSMRGDVAIRNLFWIELFDKCLQELPRQRIGFYLCENQSWERALIHAWKKHGHGRLVGVVHATVRFWDLRHFADPRVFQVDKKHPLPQPDRIVLNGRAAVDAYIQAGNALFNIVECEALRFSYLNNMSRGKKVRGNTCGRVLILGGVMYGPTNKMINILDKSIPLLMDELNFTFKPHPTCMVRTDKYPQLKLNITTEPLEKILMDYDIALASNTTSAAVDAYLTGMPVIVMLDNDGFNMSPLRGRPGVYFISNPKELATAFELAKNIDNGKNTREDFFFLDPKFSRWRRLLGL